MEYTSQIVNYFQYQQTSWARSLTYNIGQTSINVNADKFINSNSYNVQMKHYDFQLAMLDITPASKCFRIDFSRRLHLLHDLPTRPETGHA